MYESETVICSNCKTVRFPESQKCNYCGSVKSTYHIVLLDVVDVSECIYFKQKSNLLSSKQKVRMELIDGVQASFKYVKVYKYREIDRDHDLYKEVVKTLDGEFIVFKKGKLTNHKWHGSAKAKQAK